MMAISKRVQDHLHKEQQLKSSSLCRFWLSFDWTKSQDLIAFWSWLDWSKDVWLPFDIDSINWRSGWCVLISRSWLCLKFCTLFAWVYRLYRYAQLPRGWRGYLSWTLERKSKPNSLVQGSEFQSEKLSEISLTWVFVALELIKLEIIAPSVLLNLSKSEVLVMDLNTSSVKVFMYQRKVLGL